MNLLICALACWVYPKLDELHNTASSIGLLLHCVQLMRQPPFTDPGVECKRAPWAGVRWVPVEIKPSRHCAVRPLPSNAVLLRQQLLLRFAHL